MSKALQDSAMLAALSITSWSARKYDRTATAEVDSAHGAKDAGRYNKLLVAKESLAPIEQISGAARTHLYKVTLPWGENGERLLPSALFFEFTEAMKSFKNEFESRVKTFCAAYPALVTDARARLGTLYNPEDYPGHWQVGDKFSFKVDFSPVASGDDFRVQLNQDVVDGIRADITARMEERQTQAVKDCWMRVRKVVTNMHERLCDQDAIFKDSLIGNARQLIDILPALNLTNDPELTQIAAELQTILMPPDRLRADKGLRADTARKANEILAKLPWA